MAPGTLTILPMQIKDMPAVLALESDTAGAWSRELLEGELKQPTGFQFVVRDERSQQILASCCGRICADEAEILKLNVVPHLRRKGIGSRLLDHVMRHAAIKGAEYCFLELRASNTAARNLYVKKGFVVIGTRKNYYGKPREDAILMRCRVTGKSKFQS